MSEFSTAAMTDMTELRTPEASRRKRTVRTVLGLAAAVMTAGCGLVTHAHGGAESTPSGSVAAPATPGTGAGPYGANTGDAKPGTTMPGEQASPTAATHTIKEIVDNGLGAPVYADNHGRAVTDGPARIPNETAVEVLCYEPNASGMSSVTEFYVITGGEFDGDRSPSDVFRNGGQDGPNPFNVDPAVKPC